jgi:Phospholipase_D-nuclease N-terminal
MLKALIVVVPAVLAIYCLVQVAQSRADLVRTLPRWLWAVGIVLLPVLGPIGWLFLGRPKGPRQAPPPRRGRPLAPDDDPDFLRGLRFKKPDQKPDDPR